MSVPVDTNNRVATGNGIVQDDAFGNMNQTGSLAFSAAFNAQNQIVGQNYDAAGNMLSDGVHNYTYDAESQITNVDATSATYVYDANGSRVRKNTGANFTEYVYFGGQPIAEKDQAGAWTDYIFAGGKRIAMATGTTSAGTSYYYGDQLGSQRLMTNASGGIITGTDRTYLPFGWEWNATISANHYKFTGKERDSETGNDYFGARYYNASMGRFLSADTKQFALRHLLNPQKLNKYSYVLNNPLVSIDPDGLEDFSVFVTYSANQIRSAKNTPNWGKIQSNAAKHGNTVTVYQGDAANSSNLQKSLSSGQTTVVIGHTQLVDGHAAAVSMSDKEVGQPGAPGQMGAGRQGVNGGPDIPAEMPKVNGGTVAVIGCGSQSLAGQYSGANMFIGVDSGTGIPVGSAPTTSIDGLAAAGGTLVNDLASGKDISGSVSDANKAINQDPKQDKGDHLVVKKKDD